MKTAYASSLPDTVNQQKIILIRNEEIKCRNSKGSIADFTKAINKKPTFEEAYLNRGFAKLT
jgi:hypothetical protein